ncbi:MAG: SpoIVB peptidase S55 domain-containing protein [Candidatus Saccharicenans sp.]|nr:SpoIVB peptidase S55 domain-containing protein [Candidatus Saccharicenans sp.]
MSFSSQVKRLRIYFAVSIFIVFRAALSLPVEAGPTAIMPLSQVKPGMKGEGRSVFAGQKVEKFQVEILGIMENVQPRRNVILARLQGLGLENTGVVAGMSGSPVYIDGQLIGAVAFSYAFAREAIAGITPIEEMLALTRSAESVRRPGGGFPEINLSEYSQEQLGRFYAEKSWQRAESPGLNKAFIPVKIPLIFSGFSEKSFQQFQSFFSQHNFQPVLGIRASSPQTLKLKPEPISLSEGQAVGIQLISGDLDLTAIGTVTYVDGQKILALGHPFYNLGPVDYGLTTAEVMTVVPSLQSSFKLASTGKLIGRVVQDRTSGLLAEGGTLPRYIPLNIELQESPVVRKQFKLKLVNDQVLTPALINMALYTLLTSEERSYGQLSADFEADIFLEGVRTVHLEDLFSGNMDTASTGLSGLVAAVVYMLKNNEFKDLTINQIEVKIRVVEQPRIANLEKVLLDRYEVQPGEVIKIKTYFRTYNNELKSEEVEFLTPSLPPGTEFQLVVAEASYIQQLERSLYRIQDFRPRSLDQLIRLLGNLRKNNRIYFKVVAPRPGLFLKGEELPNLPPTLKNMFLSPRASTPGLTEISRSTLIEYQLPVPYVFRGAVTVPVRIKK